MVPQADSHCSTVIKQERGYHILTARFSTVYRTCQGSKGFFVCERERLREARKSVIHHAAVAVGRGQKSEPSSPLLAPPPHCCLTFPDSTGVVPRRRMALFVCKFYPQSKQRVGQHSPASSSAFVKELLS